MLVRNHDLGFIRTKNFSVYEFCNSKSGNSIKLNLDLMFKCQSLRDVVGPITVTSGYRTVDFNKACGGSPNSHHLKGEAADLRFNFDGWTVYSLTRLFRFIGFTNVNFYLHSNGKIDRVHVDVGKTWNGKEFNYRKLDLKGNFISQIS